jgi:peptide/nickel transport system permease protein
MKRHSRLVGFFVRLAKEKPLGIVGLAITLLLIFTGIFAEFLAPYGMNELTENLMAPPSPNFWLGTDNLGRDVLSRVIFGARVSLIIGLATSTLSLFISTAIGMLSGYFGGKFDMVVQRLVDAWMCFPGIIILMVLISIIGKGLWQVVIVLGLLEGILCSRIIRGSTISIKQNVYVQAAVAIGCSTPSILVRHILPNIMGPIIILFSVLLPEVILIEAALSFLGFGIPPPMPSWGNMLSGTGRSYMHMAPWVVLWPGLALAIVVYGINMFGDAVRDLLDPRLRGGVGRYGVRGKIEIPKQI